MQRFAKPWYRMRALRIFLDTADLTANPALWPSIEDGLSSSRWFILLASEDAAASKWVNREAQWWIDHGSRDRLLVVGTSPGLDWVSSSGTGPPTPRCPRRRVRRDVQPRRQHGGSADADGTVGVWEVPVYSDPYAALCADVGPPARQVWDLYAPGEPQPAVCG